MQEATMHVFLSAQVHKGRSTKTKWKELWAEGKIFTCCWVQQVTGGTGQRYMREDSWTGVVEATSAKACTPSKYDRLLWHLQNPQRGTVSHSSCAKLLASVRKCIGRRSPAPAGKERERYEEMPKRRRSMDYAKQGGLKGIQPLTQFLSFITTSLRLGMRCAIQATANNLSRWKQLEMGFWNTLCSKWIKPHFQ